MLNVEKNCYYIVLGVDGEDTIYLDLKDKESFDRVVQAILRANIRADINVDTPLKVGGTE